VAPSDNRSGLYTPAIIPTRAGKSDANKKMVQILHATSWMSFYVDGVKNHNPKRISAVVAHCSQRKGGVRLICARQGPIAKPGAFGAHWEQTFFNLGTKEE
jgi:hypothetical protein